MSNLPDRNVLLVVEDEPDWFSEVKTEMEEVDPNIKLIWADTEEKGLRLIAEHGPGLIAVTGDHLTGNQRNHSADKIFAAARHAGVTNFAMLTATLAPQFCSELPADVPIWYKASQTPEVLRTNLRSLLGISGG